MSEEQLAERARELENEWQQRHEQVIAAGGLHIVGTERHESRRIDNQLRGRSGRQGDPGSSRFYLSLEDNLMRIFGDPERTKSLLKTVGMKEGEAIESRMLTRQIENAQRKVESHNFDIRKNLLEYDDVANDQRKVIYHQRNEIMSTDDIAGVIKDMRAEVVADDRRAATSRRTASRSSGTSPGLEQAFERDFGVQTGLAAWLAEDPTRHGAEAAERLLERDRGRLRREVDAGRRTRACAISSARSCSSSSTCTGASTWPAWTTCARASICAPMRRSTRSRNTSAKHSRCSARCSTASAAIPSCCCSACRCAPKRRSSARRPSASGGCRAGCSSSTRHHRNLARQVAPHGRRSRPA